MYSSNRLKTARVLGRQALMMFGFAAAVLSTWQLTASGRPPIGTQFRGATAFAATRRAVSFGERPSGSDAIATLRTWIISELRPLGGQLSTDAFTAQTPIGPISMVNIILKFPGTSGRAVVVTGHYDTKRIAMVHFVGANDAGSSTGFLIEFAHAISTLKHHDDIYVIFFDGEEAIASWSATDGTYGSRHLAAKWAGDGTLSRIKALINVDMIGDKDLDIANDENSSQSLRSMVRHVADSLGYAKFFRYDEGGVEDDHKPFVDAGVNAIDIIDLDYGPRDCPNGCYWHTANDTMDKLSVHSFQVVGDVVVQLVKALEEQDP